MTGQQVVKRLKAFRAGKPLPLGETLRIRRLPEKDVLVLAFVRMGGESSPWGVAYGSPGKRPTILTVPEPRNRDMVAEMMAQLAPALLKHLEHPEHGGRWTEDGKLLPSRQIWLPNATHLEMLQNLSYTYTFTKFGAASRYELLNKLGRAAGWLFREAHRPGQTAVVVATEALATSYTFPAEDIRQGHLGFLMAWLTTKGGRNARMAAAEIEERESIATSLNPALEAERLEPALADFNDARTAKDDVGQGKHAAAIDGILRDPLKRRFDLTCAALEALRNDARRENLGICVLEKATRDEQYRQYIRIEKRVSDPEDGPAFVPSPETDRYPAAAASRYFVQEASQDLIDTLLVHDDSELQDEMIAEGRAVRGRITSVEDEHPGRRTVPVWKIDADASLPLRLREGSEVCVVGCPGRRGELRDVETVKSRYRIEVQITSLVTAPRDNPRVLPATSPKLVGQIVTLVTPPKDGIARLKSRKVWSADVPGSRLTHPRPSGLKAELPDDIAEQDPVEV